MALDIPVSPRQTKDVNCTQKQYLHWTHVVSMFGCSARLLALLKICEFILARHQLSRHNDVSCCQLRYQLNALQANKTRLAHIIHDVANCRGNQWPGEVHRQNSGALTALRLFRMKHSISQARSTRARLHAQSASRWPYIPMQASVSIPLQGCSLQP